MVRGIMPKQGKTEGTSEGIRRMATHKPVVPAGIAVDPMDEGHESGVMGRTPTTNGMFDDPGGYEVRQSGTARNHDYGKDSDEPPRQAQRAGLRELMAAVEDKTEEQHVEPDPRKLPADDPHQRIGKSAVGAIDDQ